MVWLKPWRDLAMVCFRFGRDLIMILLTSGHGVARSCCVLAMVRLRSGRVAVWS